mmetsp:Transcript_49939/g.100537  ORF Transcript_49939/g.100537 Transcript_49939/m.100537 type:complete len:239 (+) Transcript_49939:1148-1864(+)
MLRLRVEGVEGRSHAAGSNGVQGHLHHVVVHEDRPSPDSITLQRSNELVCLLAHQRCHGEDAPAREGPRQYLVGGVPLGVLVLGKEEAPAEGAVHQGIEWAPLEGLAVAAARLVVLPEDLLDELGVPQQDGRLPQNAQLANAVVGAATLQDQAPRPILKAVLAELEECLYREEAPIRQLHGGDRAGLLLPQGVSQQERAGDSGTEDARQAQEVMLGVGHVGPSGAHSRKVGCGPKGEL